MHKLLTKFIHVIAFVLLIVAMIFISFQTIELLWESFQNLFTRFSERGLHGLDFNPEYGMTALVLFFNVLLGLELLETIKVFNQSHTIKVKIILLICLIAISRKIFIMDIEKHEALEDFGVAAVILALSISYFLVSKQMISGKNDAQNNRDEHHNISKENTIQ